MVRQFRDFLLRGNVVDLAVAVVVGAAFGAVVTSLVADIITCC
jgi:large conductance mechanosensitive channel